MGSLATLLSLAGVPAYAQDTSGDTDSDSSGQRKTVRPPVRDRATLPAILHSRRQQLLCSRSDDPALEARHIGSVDLADERLDDVHGRNALVPPRHGKGHGERNAQQRFRRLLEGSESVCSLPDRGQKITEKYLDSEKKNR
jgi:hypothetical protein